MKGTRPLSSPDLLRQERGTPLTECMPDSSWASLMQKEPGKASQKVSGQT